MRATAATVGSAAAPSPPAAIIAVVAVPSCAGIATSVVGGGLPAVCRDTRSDTLIVLCKNDASTTAGAVFLDRETTAECTANGGESGKRPRRGGRSRRRPMPTTPIDAVFTTAAVDVATSSTSRQPPQQQQQQQQQPRITTDFDTASDSIAVWHGRDEPRRRRAGAHDRYENDGCSGGGAHATIGNRGPAPPLIKSYHGDAGDGVRGGDTNDGYVDRRYNNNNANRHVNGIATTNTVGDRSARLKPPPSPTSATSASPASVAALSVGDAYNVGVGRECENLGTTLVLRPQSRLGLTATVMAAADARASAEAAMMRDAATATKHAPSPKTTTMPPPPGRPAPATTASVKTTTTTTTVPPAPIASMVVITKADAERDWPLTRSWTFWLHKPCFDDDYEASRCAVHDAPVRDIVGFWRHFNHLMLPSAFPNRGRGHGGGGGQHRRGASLPPPKVEGWSVFEHGVTPDWESARNRNGATLTFRAAFTCDEIDSVWTHTVLALVGETAAHAERVVGARIVDRLTAYRLEVWLDVDEAHAIEDVRVWFERDVIGAAAPHRCGQVTTLITPHNDGKKMDSSVVASAGGIATAKTPRKRGGGGGGGVVIAADVDASLADGSASASTTTTTTNPSGGGGRRARRSLRRASEAALDDGRNGDEVAIVHPAAAAAAPTPATLPTEADVIE